MLAYDSCNGIGVVVKCKVRFDVYKRRDKMIDSDELNLREIIVILKKHIKILFAVPIVFSLIGVLVSIYVLDPVYESSTTIIVRQNILDGEEMSKTDVDLSKSLIYTYAEMAKSNTVLNNTKKSLNLESISRESISVLPVKDTQILEVKVHNKDPESAMNIANAIVVEFMLEVIRITKADNVAVVDYASFPSNPISPNVVMNTVISGMLGGMLALLTVFLMEYFDNTIKSEKDIEKHLKISSIGTISNFIQGGKQEYEYAEYGKVYGERSS